MIYSYDGFDTGTFLGDAMRRIQGDVGGCFGGASGVFNSIPPALLTLQNSGPYNLFLREFDSQNVVPTANEFRVSSLSVLFLILY